MDIALSKDDPTGWVYTEIPYNTTHTVLVWATVGIVLVTAVIAVTIWLLSKRFRTAAAMGSVIVVALLVAGWTTSQVYINNDAGSPLVDKTRLHKNLTHDIDESWPGIQTRLPAELDYKEALPASHLGRKCELLIRTHIPDHSTDSMDLKFYLFSVLTCNDEVIMPTNPSHGHHP